MTGPIDIIACLEAQARNRGSAPALCDGALSLSYADLFERVAGCARALRDFPRRVGVHAENGIEWVIADLALTATGITLVPLPTGYSDAQLAHICADAGVGAVLHDAANKSDAERTGLPAAALETITRSGATVLPARSIADEGAADRIIYTSGTTGRPKGVRIGTAQMRFMTSALARAIGARESDRYMSVLPFALLLEQLCAIHVPFAVGGSVHLATGVAEAAARGCPGDVAGAAADIRPTVTVLVPELLRIWLAGLGGGEGATGSPVPESLRLVAVGGAPVAPALARAAWQAGIPVHEGYGLSECTSVVALNRPGARMAGTVGRPLDGVDVEIAGDGEIVVRGPSVMQGYVGGSDPEGHWSTGDIGRRREDGTLEVLGRRDSVIVTGFGRNVSPEWIEAMLCADPRIARAAVVPDGGGGLAAIVLPTRAGAAWLETVSGLDRLAAVARLCADAPDYAVPRVAVFMKPEEAAAAGVIDPSGRIDRARAREAVPGLRGAVAV